MNAIVRVHAHQRLQDALAHVRDARLRELHVLAHDARETALAHVLHHDLRLTRRDRPYPELVLPVEAVAHPYDVVVVAGLLQRELVADVQQLAQTRHLHRHLLLRLHVRRLVPTMNQRGSAYTVLKPPSPIISFIPR